MEDLRFQSKILFYQSMQKKVMSFTIKNISILREKNMRKKQKNMLGRRRLGSVNKDIKGSNIN